MLDPEENSGIFTFLVGMIVLVMVGVGFSVLVDKRFKFSSGLEDLKKEIEVDASDLRDLALRVESGTEILARSGTNLRNSSKEHAETKRELVLMETREKQLREELAELQGVVGNLEADFARYRAEYRRRTWGRAVGESLGHLTIRGGREYRDSVINKVTEVGLEIRHEHGIARLQAPDLSQAIQDRFQWNDEERRLRLKEEEDRLDGDPEEDLDGKAADAKSLKNRGDSPLKPVVAKETTDDRAARKTEIAARRHLVRGWKAKAIKLSREQRDAAFRSRSGGGNSVPGSLETWRARSSRLGNELSKALVELEIARSRLADVNPEDPLLKPDGEQ